MGGEGERIPMYQQYSAVSLSPATILLPDPALLCLYSGCGYEQAV